MKFMDLLRIMIPAPEQPSTILYMAIYGQIGFARGLQERGIPATFSSCTGGGGLQQRLNDTQRMKISDYASDPLLRLIVISACDNALEEKTSLFPHRMVPNTLVLLGDQEVSSQVLAKVPRLTPACFVSQHTMLDEACRLLRGPLAAAS